MSRYSKKIILAFCLVLLLGLSACKVEMMGSLTEITMDDFHQRVEEDETFIVLFSQTTCSFCKSYKENLKEYMMDNALHVSYIEVDKEENQDAFDTLLVEELTELEYLPATIYIKDGEIIDFCEGELFAEQIEIWLYRNGIELD